MLHLICLALALNGEAGAAVAKHDGKCLQMALLCWLLLLLISKTSPFVHFYGYNPGEFVSSQRSFVTLEKNASIEHDEPCGN